MKNLLHTLQLKALSPLHNRRRRPLSPPILLVALLLATHLVACRRKAEPQKGSRQAQMVESPLRVGRFKLLDQHAQPVDETIFKAAPAVVAFMFTRCPTVCPRITKTMVKLRADAAAQGLALRFMSISVDPEFDQPEVLGAYAKKYGADKELPLMPEWLFLSGEHERIAEISEKGFRMGLSGQFDETKPHLGITHGSHFILVDKNGVIINYYRSAEPERLAQLLKDAQALNQN